jgi:hypothetical protein
MYMNLNNAGKISHLECMMRVTDSRHCVYFEVLV